MRCTQIRPSKFGGSFNYDVMFIAKDEDDYSPVKARLEHQMKRLYRKAGLDIDTGSLHILRRTFATKLYRRTKDVKLMAAYIGDLDSTVMKYYIAAREKVISTDGSVQQVIRIHED